MSIFNRKKKPTKKENAEITYAPRNPFILFYEDKDGNIRRKDNGQLRTLVARKKGEA